VYGIKTDSLSSYTFANVTSAHTVTGYFSINIYSISTNSIGNGSISPSTPSVNHGDNQGFTITPDPGYHITDVVVDAGSVGSVGNYDFLNVTSAHTIDAYFAVNQYTITTTDNGNGTTSPSDPLITHNGNQQFGITPSLGYHIDSVVVDGVNMGVINTYSFFGVTSAHAIDVFYSENIVLQGEYAVDANTGLLLHFNETSGSAVYDQSPNVNNGSVTGATITTGRFGNARTFNGSGDFIQLPKSNAYHSASNITIEAWVRHTAGSGLNPRIISNGQMTGYELFLDGLSADPLKRVGFASRNGGGDLGLDLYSSKTLAENTWYHIAFTYNGSFKKIYINGVLDTIASASGNIPTTSNDLTIGTITDNHGDGLFKGSIDEVRISNTVRTAGQFPVQLPPVITSVSASGTTISVNWTNGGGAAPFLRYRVYRGLDSTTMTKIDSLTGTSYADNGLLGPAVYFYRLSAVDSTGFESNRSFAFSDTVFDYVAPAAPASLVASAADGQVQIHWNPNGEGDFAKYYVYRGTSPNPAAIIDSISTFDDTLRTYSGLVNGRQYYFRLTAMDTSGNVSGFSNEVNAVPMGLVAWFPFNGLLTDSSGNGYSTSNFGTTFQEDRFNSAGRALYFDGTDSVRVNDTGILSGYRNATISYWVNAQNGGTNPRTFSKWNVLEMLRTGGVISMQYNAEPQYDGTVFPYSAWTHIVVLKDSTDVRFYVDGVLSNNFTVSGSVFNTNAYPLLFGAKGVGSGDMYQGSLDDFRIYNYTMSPASIQSLYTTGGWPAPAAPANLVAAGGESQVQIHWNPNGEGDFGKYYIYRGTSPNPTTIFDSTSSIDDTLKIYSGLTNYTTYYFRIAARDSFGNLSAYSNEVSGTPIDLTAPSAPLNLATAQADGYIQLSWDANSETDLKRYYIFQDAAPNPTTLIDSTNGLETVKNITAPNFTTYHYRIAAKDTNGNVSTYSNDVAVAAWDLTPPALPAGITAVAYDDSVVLRWNAATEPDFGSYYVYSSTAPNASGFIGITADTTFTVTGLTDYQTYYFRLGSKDTSGNLNVYSSEVSATPTDLTPPAATTLRSVYGNTGNVLLKWNKSLFGDAGIYRIYFGTASPAVTLLDSTLLVTDTTKTISGLANGTVYYFRVSVVDTNGNESLFSNELYSTPVIPSLTAYTNDGNTTALFHLDETSGTVLSDHSSNAIVGTISSSVPVSGRSGSGRSLSGSNDYIQLLDAPALRHPDITIEGWFKFNTTAGTQVLISKTAGAGMADSYIIYFSGGVLNASVGDGGGMGTFINAPFNPITGKWYHIAFTFNDAADQQYLYVDGVEIGASSNLMSIGYDAHPVLVGAEIENEALTVSMRSGYRIFSELPHSSNSNCLLSIRRQMHLALRSAWPGRTAAAVSH
jgi:fibronectin type 3 domain-containing protein